MSSPISASGRSTPINPVHSEPVDESQPSSVGEHMLRMSNAVEAPKTGSISTPLSKPINDISIFVTCKES